MGRSKKYNMLAAQVRILRRSVDCPSLGLQDLSIELHGFHCSLVGYNIHFASEALARCSSSLPQAHVKWARRLHQRAATERHEVFCPTEPGPLPCPVAVPAVHASEKLTTVASVLDIPLPSGAFVVECAALEARLSMPPT